MKKFDPTKPVQTRDGKPARIICHDRRGVMPIVVLVEENKVEFVMEYLENGQFYEDDDHHPNDLVNITTKKWRWVFLHKSGSTMVSMWHYSEAELRDAHIREYLQAASIFGRILESEIEE